MNSLMIRLLTAAFVVSATQAAVADTEIIPGVGCKVFSCHSFEGRSTFTATNKQNENSKTNTNTGMTVRGCVSTLFTENQLVNGVNNVVIKVQETGTSRTVSETCNYKKAMPTPAPTPTPAPQKSAMNLSDVAATAHGQANNLANIVSEYYGRVENFKYNFALGLLDGVESVIPFEGAEVRTQEYREGRSEGLLDGQIAGHRNVAPVAEKHADADGKDQAIARFRAVLDNPQAILNTALPAQIGRFFVGLEPLNPVRVKSLRQRLLDRNNYYRRLIEQLVGGREGIEVGLGSPILKGNVEELYYPNRNILIANSYLAQELIWEVWLKRINPEINKSQNQNEGDMGRYWAKLTTKCEFSNCAEAVVAFEDAFKRQYTKVILGKWKTVVTAANPTAQRDGRYLGRDAAQEYARDLGFAEGFKLGHVQGSIQGYDRAYRSEFTSSFQSTVLDYLQNPKLHNLEVKVTTIDNNDKFVAGMPLKVTVVRLENLGRVDGREIKTTISSNYSNAGVAGALNVEKSTTARDQVFENVAELGANIPARGTVNVQVRVGQSSVNVPLKMNWWLSVEAIAHNSKHDPARSRIYTLSKAQVLRQLAEEWRTRGDDWGVNFGQGGADTLIQEFLRVQQHVKKEGRDSQLIELKSEIRAIYDSNRGGGLFGQQRARNYHAVTQLLTYIN